MIQGKKGVLIVNLGTPDDPGYWAVRKYLKQFLLDERVLDISWLGRNLLVRGIIAPFCSRSSSKLYKMLWTPEGSPLKVYGKKLEKELQPLLGEDYEVVLAMRYQSPSIKSAIDKLMDMRVSEIIVLPLFPHYASASTGSVHEEVMRILSKELAIPKLTFINSYYDNEAMIDVFVENAQQFDLPSYDHVLFSFHGLPERQMVKADRGNHCLGSKDCCKTLTTKNQFCYTAQCHVTAYAIAKKMGLSEDQFTICFQSRLGRAEWVKPYTSDVLEVRAKAGDKRLLVFCPAFVSDCLETTIEVSTEYQEEFEELGGEHVDLVPSLNDHPKWIEAVRDMVLAEV